VSDDDVTDRLSAAISAVLADSYVTRWVSLIEVIDEDGDRAVWTLHADDMRAWDTLGLLTFGTQIEQAALVRGDD